MNVLISVKNLQGDVKFFFEFNAIGFFIPSCYVQINKGKPREMFKGLRGLGKTLFRVKAK